MKESARYLTGFLVAAFLLTGASQILEWRRRRRKTRSSVGTKAEKEIANITMLMENDRWRY